MKFAKHCEQIQQLRLQLEALDKMIENLQQRWFESVSKTVQQLEHAGLHGPRAKPATPHRSRAPRDLPSQEAPTAQPRTHKAGESARESARREEGGGRAGAAPGTLHSTRLQRAAHPSPEARQPNLCEQTSEESLCEQTIRESISEKGIPWKSKQGVRCVSTLRKGVLSVESYHLL